MKIEVLESFNSKKEQCLQQQSCYALRNTANKVINLKWTSATIRAFKAQGVSNGTETNNLQSTCIT